MPIGCYNQQRRHEKMKVIDIAVRILIASIETGKPMTAAQAVELAEALWSLTHSK